MQLKWAAPGLKIDTTIVKPIDLLSQQTPTSDFLVSVYGPPPKSSNLLDLNTGGNFFLCFSHHHKSYTYLIGPQDLFINPSSHCQQPKEWAVRLMAFHSWQREQGPPASAVLPNGKCSLFVIVLLFFFFSMATPAAYESSRARDWIWSATATYTAAVPTSDLLTHCARTKIEPVSL